MKTKLLKWIPLFVLILSLLVSCNGGGHTDGTENNGGNPTPSAKPDPVLNEQNEVIDVYEAFEKKESGLPYRIYVPADYSEEYAYPVLLFLHGAGERGEDNELQLKNVIQKLFDDPTSPVYQSIVIVPQCPIDEKWVDRNWNEGNYDLDRVEESDELKEVLAILETVKNTYSVNDNRIYAMGISMGGFGTWDLILRHGELFAAAVPICGGGDPKYADLLLNIPIYTIHGDADGTVSVETTREMVEALEACGSTLVTYEELEGYGHNVWDYAAQKRELIDWLFSQRLTAEN